MQLFLLYYGTTLCLKMQMFVMPRFLFFYPIKIDILVAFERKKTEHGLRVESAMYNKPLYSENLFAAL